MASPEFLFSHLSPDGINHLKSRGIAETIRHLPPESQAALLAAAAGKGAKTNHQPETIDESRSEERSYNPGFEVDAEIGPKIFVPGRIVPELTQLPGRSGGTPTTALEIYAREQERAIRIPLSAVIDGSALPKDGSPAMAIRPTGVEVSAYVEEERPKLNIVHR